MASTGRHKMRGYELNHNNDVEGVGNRELAEDEPEFRLHPGSDQGAGHSEDIEPRSVSSSRSAKKNTLENKI